MVNTAVTLCGLPLENPVIPASGTFGYGYEFAQIYDINCLGTFSFKGTTLDPPVRQPHPPHRRVRRRACSTLWGCKTPVWRPSSGRSCPVCGRSFTSR